MFELNLKLQWIIRIIISNTQQQCGSVIYNLLQVRALL